MKRRALSLILTLSLLLSILLAGPLSAAEEQADIAAPVAIATEEAFAEPAGAEVPEDEPPVEESLVEEPSADEPPVEPADDPAVEPEEEVVEAPEVTAAPEEAQPDAADPEPPAQEHPVFEMPAEALIEEEPALFASVEDVESADLRSAPALGSDGVAYEDVAYLSQAAFDSLSEEQQDTYVQMADDVAEMLNAGAGITDIVFSLDEEGTLGFNYAIPMETFAEGALDAGLESAVEEEAGQAGLQEVEAKSGGAHTAEPAPAEAQESEPIVENVELAERVAVPLVKIGGAQMRISGAAFIGSFGAQSYNTMYTSVAEQNFFYDQLSDGAKAYYDAGKVGIVDQGNNGFEIKRTKYSPVDTLYMVDALSALILNYPESFDWMAPGGILSYGGLYYKGSNEYDVQGTLQISAHYKSSLETDARNKVSELVGLARAYAKENYPNDIDYGIIKYLDDWICRTNYYNNVGTATDAATRETKAYYYCHSSYGTLNMGYGVCESYARAMSRLLDAANIPNVYVVGQAGGGGHAWNYVRMSDGKYYMLDSTWNDGGASSNMSYFLCEGRANHVPTGAGFTSGNTFKFPALSTTPYERKQSPSAATATPEITPEPTHPLFEPVKVQSIALNPSALTLNPSDKSALKVTVVPETASSQFFKWTSNRATVATVDRNGVITAVGNGSATITCAATDGSGVTATCEVVVSDGTNIPVTGLALNHSTTSIIKGNGEILKPVFTPTNATNKAVTWSSNREGVATVDGSGYVRAVSVGQATITCTSNDGGFSATCDVTVTPLLVNRIALNETRLTLEKRASGKLTATISPADADDPSVEWTSSSDAVATVDADGTVTAGSQTGTAKITCTAKDGSKKFAECTVTVTQIRVKRITLSEAPLTLTRGEECKLTPAIEPRDADNQGLNWITDNGRVATVDSDGMVHAVGKGTATITCASRDGSGVKAECAVTVNPIWVSSISLSEAKLTLEKGASEALAATVEPANADNRALIWKSEPASVATVKNGVVTAVSAGEATITCTAADGSGETAICQVTVNPRKVATISLNKRTLALEAGKSETLTAAILPKDADDKEVKWTSDSPGIASVEGGVVTAVAVGEATITCAAADGSGASDTCVVTVRDVLPTKIALNRAKQTMGVGGDTLQLVPTLTPASALPEVTYSSSNDAVASVNAETGLVTTGGKAGKATITATTVNGRKATCAVTVNAAPAGVKLDQAQITLAVGQQTEKPLKASLTGGYACSGFAWRASSDAVTVEGGAVKAERAGEADAPIDVTVSAEVYNGKRAECVVHVLPAPKAVELSAPGEVTLGVGETLTLTASVPGSQTKFAFTGGKGEGGATVAAIKATRKNETVTITAKAVGTTVVRAETHVPEVFGECVITVLPAPKRGDLSLSETGRTLGVGEDFVLTATLAEGKASKLTATTSNKRVAAVTEVAPGEFKVTTSAANQKTGTATITVKTFNKVSKTCKITVKRTPTGDAGMLTIKPEKLTLAEKQTATLTANYKKNYGGGVTWSIDGGGTGAAEIDPKSGALTALKAGTVTVRATSYNELAVAEREVTIEPEPETVEAEESIELGLKESLTLTPVAKSGETVVTAATFTYESDMPSVVAVDNRRSKITAKTVGEANITVAAYNGVEKQIHVTVKVAPTAVKICNIPNPRTLGIGEPWTLETEISAKDRKGNAFECAGGVTFKTSNRRALEVDPHTGVLTAKAAGTAKITAKTYNGKSASVTIAVKAAPTEIRLDKAALTMGVDEPNIKLTASFANKKQYGHVTWTSDREDVVAVAGGVLTAKQTGTATIAASVYNQADPENPLTVLAPCVVTVKSAPKPEAMQLTLPKELLDVGKVMTAELAYDEGTAGAYSFKSSNKRIAAVNASTGAIKGVKAGKVMIQAVAYNGATVEKEIEIVAKPTKAVLLNKIAKMGVGESWKLGAQIKSGKADITEKVYYEFKSNNDALIHVDPVTGELTAGALPEGKSSASAKITVRAYNGKSASVKITVYPAPTKITLLNGRTALNEGAQLGPYGAGESVKLGVAFEPAGSYANVKWASQNEGAASVSNAIVIAGEAAETATITASAYNEALTANCEIVVKEAPTAKNTTLVPAKEKIGVGESVATKFIFANSAGAVKSYRSRNTKIATVSKAGVIRGVKAGKTTITATMYNNVQIPVEVEIVKGPTGLAIKNAPDGYTLTAGKEWTPEFEIAGYGGEDLSNLVTGFISSKVGVAEFKSGVLTAKAPGTTRITCKTYNGKAASFNLTVVAAEAE